MGDDVERELRAAMAEHTREVSAPSSMVEKVRRRHRRHVVRARAAGAVALVAVVALGLPVYRAAVREPSTGQVASPPSATETTRQRTLGVIGGVRVTYLPPEVRADGRRWPEEDNSYPAGSGDRGCTWDTARHVDGPQVQIAVFRGVGDLAELRERTSVGGDPHMTRVRGRPAVAGDRADSEIPGREVMWVERPGLGLHVIVTNGLEDQLDEIVNGLEAGRATARLRCSPAPTTSEPR